MTQKEARALDILASAGTKGLTAREFAVRYFTERDQEYLFTAVSNQGNGACAGKKAWLCAGSLLGKLRQKGYVKSVPYSEPRRYTTTVSIQKFNEQK